MKRVRKPKMPNRRDKESDRGVDPSQKVKGLLPQIQTRGTTDRVQTHREGRYSEGRLVGDGFGRGF